jgi:sigma-B regulation protein RsbU (phosphoserine phosphatase)
LRGSYQNPWTDCHGMAVAGWSGQYGSYSRRQVTMTSHVSSPPRPWRSAEMLEHELDLARDVQESLFPAEIPKLPGIRVAALNQPARIVSGDLYDVIGIDDDRMVALCADVSGKGFAAALLAAQVQSYFRAMVQAASVVRSVLEPESVSVDVFRSLGSLPLLVVRQLNATACRHMRLPGRYATLFFAEIDGRDGTVHYVNAGHNPPLLLASGSVVELLSAGGPPVGLFADASYEVGTATVPADGTLLIYTDGVIEARDRHDEEFGLPRLIDLCSGVGGDVTQLLPRIQEAVEIWSDGLEPTDDITLVAVGRDQ